jgi:hypothetical protein
MAGANVLTYSTPITGYDNTGLTANLGATTVYAIPAGRAGIYRCHLWIKVTTVATTSTLPSADLVFTSGGTAITTGTSTGAPGHLIATNTGNALTTSGTATVDLYCDASTNIQVVTAGYAQTGVSMVYELRVRLEYLG